MLPRAKDVYIEFIQYDYNELYISIYILESFLESSSILYKSNNIDKKFTININIQ